MITSLDQMVEKVIASGVRCRIAVAWAQEHNLIAAVGRAAQNGFAEAILIGNSDAVISECRKAGINRKHFEIINAKDDSEASEEAVRLVNTGAADIVMKGLVSTGKFLKAVMDRNNGLMIPGSVLSYVATVEIPAYNKLLFITDPAVIPYPDLDQRIKMAGYAIDLANKFGISVPRMALIGPSEILSSRFPYYGDYATLCEMSKSDQIKNCIIDGPIDLFLACDKNSVEIKGVNTPVNGDADILMFPSLESANPFYKALMLFAGGELAGIIRGTRRPVIVMSRSESEKSKYYCIALACLMN